MLDFLARHYLAKFLFCFWLMITSPPVLFLRWLGEDHQERKTILMWVTLAYAVAWLPCSWFLGNSMARHMIDDKHTFRPAMWYSLCDLRMRLAFVPIIGRWFEFSGEARRKDDEER